MIALQIMLDEELMREDDIKELPRWWEASACAATACPPVDLPASPAIPAIELAQLFGQGTTFWLGGAHVRNNVCGDQATAWIAAEFSRVRSDTWLCLDADAHITMTYLKKAATTRGPEIEAAMSEALRKIQQEHCGRDFFLQGTAGVNEE